MQIGIFIAFLIVGCFIAFRLKPDSNFDRQLSKSYLIVALFLMLNMALVNFANIQNEALFNKMLFVLNWGKSVSYLLIGFLITHITIVAKSKNLSRGYPLADIFRLTLWAIAIINGFSFLMETGYKLKNINDLVEQFAHYGYARWFLYFIIAAETLGAIGILFHFKFQSGPISACGLMIIMLGVVYSNWHVQDPFTFSYPAVDAFLSLVLMLNLYHLQRKINHKGHTVSPLIA